MKYLKGYKMFERVNLDWIKELFAYLPDDGFRVRVKENVNCVNWTSKVKQKYTHPKSYSRINQLVT